MFNKGNDASTPFAKVVKEILIKQVYFKFFIGVECLY